MAGTGAIGATPISPPSGPARRLAQGPPSKSKFLAVTPNINALAAQGMRFTDYHSNGAVCSPTRAALMTGLYQQRVGISGVVTAKRHRDVGLAVGETTIAEVLSENGYATALFGKWHLGYDPKFNPVHQGFDEFAGFISGNVDFFSHIDQEGHKDWWHGDKPTPEEGYVTHLITRHGLRFIEENKDRPFFLYLPHLSPHYPYQGPDDQPIRSADGVRISAAPDMDIPRAYRDMMVALDKGVGEIMAALDKHGLAERTLVIFCSDNGASQHGSNGPLRGHKGSIHEGGHRVPMIARWPGVIPADKVSDATALGMDFFPTLLDAAGIKAPGKLDGTSILPVLRAEADLPERTVFWNVGKGAAARRGPWKLVIEGGDRKAAGSVYHLGDDPAEERPVENPEVHQRLRKELDAWLESWQDVRQHS
ncbi:MAG: sulfatase-like hydrolase/transferase [Verrucomicrobia bacterium]|nr:sulfatase-like hydrolase/transferase [Verrucomicrobiota bacterium]MDA1007332.1 sulfatase-like hydrolase/transferase [Verrucomicrobiota bacterium]